MGDITCKFGGSSLADTACVRQAEAIIRGDSRRRFIVPSAPGKRTPDDKKITDLLYAWHSLARQGLDPSEPAEIIRQRFAELASALGVRFAIESYLDEITQKAGNDETPDYMASRGEFLNAHLLAELLDATFVEPADCILFDDEGRLDPATYDLLSPQLEGDGLFVVPGFYGALPDGRIRTFSRGGSDITGAIVARASKSELYENWTDVSGFRMADPGIVKDARRMPEVTYKELRELSYMGAKVLHDEAIYPVLKPGIPIHIRNSKKPDEPGTLIVPQREAVHPVCGIAGSKGFSMINIEKTLMNRELGFGRRVLSILEEHGVSFEHMPTGIDTISLIVRDNELAHHGPSIIKSIERNCEPDRVTLVPSLAIIATVGQGMNHHIGVAGRLFTALAQAGVNIRVIDQGSSELNIIIGVEDSDFEKAVHAIYKAFDTQE
ncbi:MAG TPA: aspartate kinase [Candidatus Hydrogenedentes bacterium]|nr:aspartate kinase [Candidatus Hydrogenedentota bacterium]